MLSLWRRHESKCPHKSKGRKCIKCQCPIWCDGEIEGVRVRKSMGTRDWARATRKLASVEDPMYGLRPCIQPGCTELVKQGRCSRHVCDLSRAIASYHEAYHDASEATRRSRKGTLQTFEEFVGFRGLQTVDQVDLESLNAFRSTRAVTAGTWRKELGTLRHFFRFCLDNEWVLRSWAEKIQMPKNLRPAAREPYTPSEVARIIAACDQIGRGPYERLRARAMVLLLRYTALRISDVATLERKRIRNGEIYLRTTKNGKSVRLPVHAGSAGCIGYSAAASRG